MIAGRSRRPRRERRFFRSIAAMASLSGFSSNAEPAWHKRLRQKRSKATLLLHTAANLLREHHGHSIPPIVERYLAGNNMINENEPRVESDARISGNTVL